MWSRIVDMAYEVWWSISDRGQSAAQRIRLASRRTLLIIGSISVVVILVSMSFGYLLIFSTDVPVVASPTPIVANPNSVVGLDQLYKPLDPKVAQENCDTALANLASITKDTTVENKEIGPQVQQDAETIGINCGAEKAAAGNAIIDAWTNKKVVK